MEDTKSFEVIGGSIEDFIETRELTPEEQEQFGINQLRDFDYEEWQRQEYERRAAEAQKAEDDYINRFVSLAKKGDVVSAIRELAKEVYELKQSKADREIILGGC